jgi:O-antigen ligase
MERILAYISRKTILYALAFLFAASLFTAIKATNAVLLILGLMFLVNVRKVKPGKSYPLAVLILMTCAYYAWEMTTLLYTEDLKEGWLRMERHSSLLVIPLIFSVFKTVDYNRLLLFFALGLIAGTLTVGTKFIIDYSIHVQAGTIDFTSDTPYSGILDLHPTYFSLFIAASIILVVRLLSDKPATTISIVLYVMYASFVIVLLSSKLGLFFLAVSLVYFVFYLWRSYDKRYGMVMAGAIFLLLVYAVVNNTVIENRLRNIWSTTFERDPVKGFNTVSGRIMFWKCSLDILSRDPLLGVGIGDAQHQLDTCYIVYEPTTNSPDFLSNYNSHNQFLQTGIETGLIGLFILLIMIYWSIRCAFAGKQYELLLIIIFIITYFMVESVLLRNRGLGIFCAIITLSALSTSNLKTKAFTQTASE